MPANRRNYYRLLHVQPDAPAEVVKAAYRALMAVHHPDAGGDHAHAVLLNEAWATLGHAQRRAAYDAQRAARLGRQQVVRQERAARAQPWAAAATGARPGDAPEHPRTRASGRDDAPADAHDGATASARRCPFCRQPVAAKDRRCATCRAPLAPLGVSASGHDASPRAHGPAGASGTRAGDRRRVPRVSKADWALLHVDWRSDGVDVRLRDLSPDGLSCYCGVPMARERRVRIVGAAFDVVGDVLTARRAGNVYVLHVRIVSGELTPGR